MTLSEDPAERADRYIQSFESSLQKNRILFDVVKVEGNGVIMISDALQRYLKDAKYYLKNNKPTTSLASIAYAEGLLDALAYLGFTKPLE